MAGWSPLPSNSGSKSSPYRYLGRGGGERPVRVQIIIALVAGLILVAVPLYLWRRPQPESIPSADAAVVDAGFVSLDAGLSEATTPGASPGGTAGDDGLKLAPFKTLRCQDPGPGKTPPERCDHLSFFEDGLSRAIRESRACAPSSDKSYSISYVMEYHFQKKQTKLYLGKSTTLRRSKAKEVLTCVQRALPEPEWDRIPHQHVKYVVNVVATYPPNGVF
jgi:hypothetical protein